MAKVRKKSRETTPDQMPAVRDCKDNFISCLIVRRCSVKHDYFALHFTGCSPTNYVGELLLKTEI